MACTRLACERRKVANGRLGSEQNVAHSANAKPTLTRLAEQFNNGPSKLMILRCDELIAYPHEGWKGVWKMENK